MDNKHAIDQGSAQANAQANAQINAQINAQKAAALDCKFTRVIRNRRPALLARIIVPIECQAKPDRPPMHGDDPQPQASQSTGHSLETLLDHAANLNVRLPLLKVSVKANSPIRAGELTTEKTSDTYVFVLHGLFGERITSQNLSRFLDLLTQDFNTFVAYAQAHNIGITPMKDKTQTTSLLA
ncbi:MAG: hypothetical protein AAFN40_07460 [Cyanobacteria bacterium J06560_6]